MAKHHGQKQPGVERAVWLVFPNHCSSLKEVRAETKDRARAWRQKLMQRPWRGAAYWFAPHGLLSLLSYRTQDHQPRDGTTYNGLGPPPLNPSTWEAEQVDL